MTDPKAIVELEIDEGEECLAAFLWMLARKPPSRGGGFRSGCE